MKKVLERFKDPGGSDFILITAPGPTGLKSRLRTYHETSGYWAYLPAYSGFAQLTDSTFDLNRFERDYLTNMRSKAGRSSNLAVVRMTLGNPQCRAGSIVRLPRRYFRIGRFARIELRNLYVRTVGLDYIIEALQPRRLRWSDASFRLAWRLEQDVFDAPEIRRHEFRTWDTGGESTISPRELRRLSSMEFEPLSDGTFRENLQAYVDAKRDLVEEGIVPLRRNVEDRPFG